MVKKRRDAECAADCLPRRRVVLLGASNLTRGISTVVETARLQAGGPIDVLAALGHGRSYGLETTVLGRTLPGIATCGLWDALAQAAPAETVALVTDIGNDLLNDVPVPRIVQWVTACVDRLEQTSARAVITLLPLANLDRLSPRRFRLFRTLLFPASKLTLDSARRQAHQLNELLLKLGQARRIKVVSPRADWYGLDPIHIKLSSWPRAWHEILTPLEQQNDCRQMAARSWRRWMYLRRLAPERRRLFGFQQRRKQPSGRLIDGTIIGMY